MARKLITIERLFELKSGAIVLFPDVNPQESLKPGDQIILRKPDGTIQFQKIGGIGYGIGYASGKTKHSISIAISGIRKEDIPIGTEVWTVD